ncbi:hypothetical protein B0A67_02245 [Flavobacterium aquidurense]|jgi:uncharacterized protein YtpQ (UPF0354 family)|uniref:DUF1444 family protein n=1 Tax=Flavobacterium aquidurense TaxID=362413 RepID=UPI00092124FC|nr:DUF1444 family protein [Flavobacterium aquidurense]OXA73898.1 hypothetical protein B0A67_02245 [Flavobacterium aquidurense]SHH39848.1 Protein of unknown function [Flavobacterium frigidimaris]
MFFKKKLLSEDEFAKKFAKELLKKVNGLKITSINNLEIVSEYKGVNDYKHFLDNCYLEYVGEAKLINEIIGRYINAAYEIYLPKENVNSERFFPIVKDKRFIKGLHDTIVDFEKSHIFESYNDELFVFYAEDRENTIHYLSKDDLKEINFPIENLHNKAIQNLSDQLEMNRHGENGYFMITAGGNYESSLILLDIWYHENFAVNGNFVIGIPARDILFITGSKDSENLHRLYDSVKNINETGDHIVSDKIFELRNGKFEVL